MRTAYYPFKSAAAREEYLAFYTAAAQKLWPVPFENLVVNTGYGPTYARVSGPKGAPPLVLLPGITATSLMWAPNVAAWSRDYRVYAVDLMSDYGLSKDTKVLWRAKDYLLWLDDYFNRLGFTDRFNLVGMSYGGWLAAIYAVAHPERLRKVALLAPGATVLRMNREFLKRSAFSGLLGGDASNHLFYWLFADGVSHPERCMINIEDFGNCLYMGFKCFQQRFFVYLSVLSDREWRELKPPTLFLVGEHEKLYDAGQALARLRRVAPQVRTGLIPEAGHDLTMVQAELINNKVLDFLRS
jgi:pimeloyl-ACP methyl ester carboxylesterase